MRVNIQDPIHYQPATGWLSLHGQKLNDEDVTEIKAFLIQHPEITKVYLEVKRRPRFIKDVEL